MEVMEASNIVYSRIKALDPDNATKILGLLLLQNNIESEMNRLTSVPDLAIQALVRDAQLQLRNPPNPNPNSPLRVDVDFPQNPISSSSLDLQQQLSFLNEEQQPHRRSLSDVCYNGVGVGVDESGELGFGFRTKPCVHYQKGFCKKGDACSFVHCTSDENQLLVGVVGDNNTNGNSMIEEIRLQQQLQQRFSNGLGSPQPYSSSESKNINYLLQQHRNRISQRAAAEASLMLGEDLNKFSRTRIERNDFLSTCGGMMNSGSRQIYLTFPADSTFREEDVSNYFSQYGPVQDVRIPYQQKRMFGFVTFVYAKTVEDILLKGNPHFVCDARVLVKPYKEKGKCPEKRHQLGERGEFPTCIIPNEFDPRDPHELQLALQMQGSPRMFYNAELELERFKRKLEVERAVERENQRMVDLHLLNNSKQHHHHHRNLSAGAIPLTNSYLSINQTIQKPIHPPLSADQSNAKALGENGSSIGNGKMIGGDGNEEDVHQNITSDFSNSCFLVWMWKRVHMGELTASPVKEGFVVSFSFWESKLFLFFKEVEKKFEAVVGILYLPLSTYYVDGESFDSSKAADPEEADAISVIRGMEAALHIGLERVLLLTDCRHLVRAFQESLDDLSWGALILAPDMLSLSSRFLEFRFEHVDRLYNYEAHVLATKGAHFPSYKNC
ncbi:hypothetical protein GIB67_006734 [Kingdonia uniflora]|uniref:Uncharacterized protein n=1 Tax=Kingdonia uniflora TaxID=39325 RepID=A0A7J7LYN4_9MAGN|nr:hypothetical protein GIB67_006734 [Kingdonia uniflora]